MRDILNSISIQSLADAEYFKKLKKKKIINLIVKILIFILLLAWAALAVFPFLWTFLSSFKNRFDIVFEPLTFKFLEFSDANYKKIFEGSLNIFRAYGNSLLISGLVVIGTLISSTLMAFVLARFKFRGKGILEMLVVACMMFPAFALLFPIIKILSALGLFGEQLGVVFPQIALNLGFTTLLLTGFLKSLPIEVEEAAFIDGAGIMRVVFTIVVPMLQSALVTASIFVFIWSYNDLFLQMIIITTEKKFPVSLLLNRLASKETGYDYGKMAAAVTLVAFPIILIYMLLQKHIIKGLTAGAVKG